MIYVHASVNWRNRQNGNEEWKRQASATLPNFLELQITHKPEAAYKLAQNLLTLGNEKIINDCSFQPDKPAKAIIRLASFAALHFMHGAWLEFFTAGALRDTFYPGDPIGPDGFVAQGVEFCRGPEKIPNELDVLMLNSNNLNIFTCKRSGFNAEGKLNNEAIYHLNSLSRNLGLFQKNYYVVCQKRAVLTDLINRAQADNITVIPFEDFPNLAEIVSKNGTN